MKSLKTFFKRILKFIFNAICEFFLGLGEFGSEISGDAMCKAFMVMCLNFFPFLASGLFFSGSDIKLYYSLPLTVTLVIIFLISNSLFSRLIDYDLEVEKLPFEKCPISFIRYNCFRAIFGFACIFFAMIPVWFLPNGYSHEVAMQDNSTWILILQNFADVVFGGWNFYRGLFGIASAFTKHKNFVTLSVHDEKIKYEEYCEEINKLMKK